MIKKITAHFGVLFFYGRFGRPFLFYRELQVHSI